MAYPIIMKASDPDYQEVSFYAEWMARYANPHCWFDLAGLDKETTEIGFSQMFNSMLEYMNEQI
jgi:hypothetical protein